MLVVVVVMAAVAATAAVREFDSVNGSGDSQSCAVQGFQSRFNAGSIQARIYNLNPVFYRLSFFKTFF